MRSARLTRTRVGDEGTFGALVTDRGFICFTGELPWRDNLPSVSSIPPGKYICTWRLSPRHGMCYHVEGVPDRTGVEIHAANFMGDVSLGYKCELEGCIAPGTGIEEIPWIGPGGARRFQTGVISSRQALLALENEFNREPFELTIV